MSSAIEQLAAGISFDTFSKAEDLKKRLWFTLMALVVYRIGSYIPLPGINPIFLADFMNPEKAGGILGVLDMFSGGSLGRMTILSLNVMPYISASIVIQLMTTVSPQLGALKKEGELGKRKLNQYTRYLTVLLAVVQGYGVAMWLESMTGGPAGAAVMDPGVLFRVATVVTLTGGTLFIMWLGEQITSRGIGNGISLIIYAGIVANLPQAALKTIQAGREGVLSGFIIFGVMIMVAAVIAYVVYMEKAQRRILIQYPKRQSAANMPATSQNTHLPLKLNSAGVIPPIFASSILLLPTTIAGFTSVDPDSWFGSVVSNMGHGKPLYMILFVCAIIFFAFFYTAIMFDPKETSDNLKKMGTFIPGVRPGEATTKYIDYVLTRLTTIGAIYLASVCILPELVLAKVSLPFYFGGTSVLIVVSVTIDTISQVQSHLVAHQYEGLFKRQEKMKKGKKR
ncbi:MAG: preprotein translocase subunit SecY [Alphaproteobacteria bacterium CG_4_10_14_0_8_um_filter_37_21]|nr:MAG: preprotein translocase subunit SecY [Alphaproteobacteria bacterium CG_4_10_14_0_8_um_filter_37_21]